MGIAVTLEVLASPAAPSCRPWFAWPWAKFGHPVNVVHRRPYHLSPFGINLALQQQHETLGIGLHSQVASGSVPYPLRMT